MVCLISAFLPVVSCCVFIAFGDRRRIIREKKRAKKKLRKDIFHLLPHVSRSEHTWFAQRPTCKSFRRILWVWFVARIAVWLFMSHDDVC